MGLTEQGNLYASLLGRKGGPEPGNPAADNKNIVFGHRHSLAQATITEMAREGQIRQSLTLNLTCPSAAAPPFSHMRACLFGSS